MGAGYDGHSGREGSLPMDGRCVARKGHIGIGWVLARRWN